MRSGLNDCDSSCNHALVQKYSCIRIDPETSVIILCAINSAENNNLVGCWFIKNHSLCDTSSGDRVIMCRVITRHNCFREFYCFPVFTFMFSWFLSMLHADYTMNLCVILLLNDNIIINYNIDNNFIIINKINLNSIQLTLHYIPTNSTDYLFQCSHYGSRH